MEWSPKRSAGGVVGSLILAALLALSGWLALTVVRNPISFTSFLVSALIGGCLALLAWVGYLLYGFFTLGYRLDRNALVIRWAASRQVIPLDRVREVRRLEGMPGLKVRAPATRWWGYSVGPGRIQGLGKAAFYATASLRDQVAVSTSAMSYAISPADAEGFLSDLEACLRVGVLRPAAEGLERSGLSDFPFWRDRGAQLLIGLGLLANALLFAYVAWRYRALPELLPLHFTGRGMVDIIGPREEIFRLPTAGLLVLCANLAIGLAVYRQERLAAYLLFGAILAVQLFLAVPILHILH